jgi:hypothetical protein
MNKNQNQNQKVLVSYEINAMVRETHPTYLEYHQRMAKA